MALSTKSFVVFLFMVMATLQVTTAAVHRVGDSNGWTIKGRPNYANWAASKTFHVGDTILFQYMLPYHSVVQVNQEDYKLCKVTNPIATYVSGNDAITMEQNGHYYFVCGVPGHCEAGMKVEIRVADPSPMSSPAAAPTPNMAAPSASMAPAPTPNMGDSILSFFAGFHA